MSRRRLLAAVLPALAAAAAAANDAPPAYAAPPGVPVLAAAGTAVAGGTAVAAGTAAAAGAAPRVAVTWYGVATLLFDDGETRILIDGFFSRPAFESLDDVVAPDSAHIARMVESAGLAGLAMITPVHSHFDHAMDLGEVAAATGAVVLGSESTANIARGAGVPESRIRVTDDTLEATFGAFRVELIRSAHAPLVDGGPPIPGVIEAPITPPARIGDWKEGGSYSIVLAHPAGTAVVQGSAGYLEGRLDGVAADVVFLGTGGLGALGKAHATRYYDEIVGATGARCVLPIHWDDFTLPFGTVAWRGDVRETRWLTEFGAARSVGLAVLPFDRPVDVFAGGCGRSG